ncbi:MAG: helicase-related protein, partial [Candidatus Saccharimonadales bacterium]
FDNDNPKRDRLEQAYDQLKSGKVDIIVGTQAVAKGLDLPKLTVVGVITADISLYLPDFSADERTYQLIRQVIGRVGRGHRPGTALIQTYNPDNPIIQAAVYGDYESFYRHELAARQKFNFPPARHMLKLTIGRASANSAEAACAKLKLTLEQSNLKIMIDGPSPCFHETKNGKHYWQLVLRANQRSELLAALSRVPVGTASELDPVSLL